MNSWKLNTNELAAGLSKNIMRNNKSNQIKAKDSRPSPESDSVFGSHSQSLWQLIFFFFWLLFIYTMHLFELQRIEGDPQSGHTYFESQVILRREGVNKRL